MSRGTVSSAILEAIDRTEGRLIERINRVEDRLGAANRIAWTTIGLVAATLIASIWATL